MAITLGLVEAVDDDGVYVSMPGARGVVRGPYRTVGDVPVGASVLVTTTDEGEPVVVGAAVAPPRLGTINVRDCGAVGDGTTDDTDAIQFALTTAVTTKSTVLLPPGTYKTTATLTIGSDTTLVGTGTIDAFIPDDTQAPVICIHGDDVTVEGITVQGNKSWFAPTTEWRHGISILSSNRVVIRDVTTADNKGDGVLVAVGEYPGDTTGDPCTQIVLDNVTSDGNHRQGLSVVSVVGLTVVGGAYCNTSGTAPQSGIDIEPNAGAGYVVLGVTIVGAQLLDNAGCGLLVVFQDVDDHAGVTVVGGRSAGNSEHGVAVSQNAARQVSIDQMVIEGNTLGGVHAYNVDLYGFRVTNNLIRDNGQPGVWIIPASTAKTCDGLSIVGNTIVDNTYYGMLIQIEGSVFTSHNRVSGSSTGIYTQYVTSEMHIGNDLTGNTTPSSYGGTAGGRTVIGPEGVGFFGAAPVAKPTVTGSRGGNAALQSLLTELANLGLITDSSS